MYCYYFKNFTIRYLLSRMNKKYINTEEIHYRRSYVRRRVAVVTRCKLSIESESKFGLSLSEINDIKADISSFLLHICFTANGVVVFI